MIKTTQYNSNLTEDHPNETTTATDYPDERNPNERPPSLEANQMKDNPAEEERPPLKKTTK